MRVYTQLEGGTVRVSVMNACGGSECRNSSGVGMSIHGQGRASSPGYGWLYTQHYVNHTALYGS